MKHSKFKKKARQHQINFRNDPEINVSPERYPKREFDRNGKHYQIPVMSSLLRTDRKDKDGSYRIFFSGFRKEITSIIDHIGDTTPIGQMVENLLRSEHIPYNVFFPMKYDLPGTATLLNALLGENKIESVDEPIIEFNPKTLADGTAFDVYIPYTSISGNKGGVGIEVKYTEKEYQLKKLDKEGNLTKEYRETHDENGIHLADNYKTPSVESGWFMNEVICDVPFAYIKRDTKHVVMNHYRQIWRNHLLGASMMLQPTEDVNHLDEFVSITIYPSDNGHFSDVLWNNYESMLTDKGKQTLKHYTYEELFPLMRQHLRNVPDVDRWIDYLNRRYIITD